MKRIWIIFALLLIAGASAASLIDMPRVSNAGMLVQAVVGGESYNAQETFDGSSACGDGSHTNCDVTWTVANVVDFNYTTVSLEGTNSCQIKDGGPATITHTLSSPFSEGYVSMMINFEDANEGGLNRDVDIFLLDASDNELQRFRLWDFDSGSTDGDWYTYYNNTTMQVGTLLNVNQSEGETVYFGMYYKAGDGTGESKFWFSDTAFTSNWGTADDSYSSLTSTASVAKIQITMNDYGSKIVVDDIRQADAQTAY